MQANWLVALILNLIDHAVGILVLKLGSELNLGLLSFRHLRIADTLKKILKHSASLCFPNLFFRVAKHLACLKLSRPQLAIFYSHSDLLCGYQFLP